MGAEKEKRPIPGTNPDWERWLPEGYDNGWNFDEKSDDGPEVDEGEADE